MSQRIREVLGELDYSCRSCGDGCLVAIETRSARRFRDRFRADPDRRVIRYQTCLDCGTTIRLSTVNPRRVSGGDTLPPGHVEL